MLVIEKRKIKDWVQELAKSAPVFVPVRRQDPEESVFKRFTPEVEIDFDYLPTLCSIKEFFLPAEEEIFVFDRKSRRLRVGTPTSDVAVGASRFILFGLNMRDLEALVQLDEIMTKPQPDFFYFQKREKATVIGLLNEPVKTPPAGDLVLEKINEEQYQAIPLTDKGKKLTKSKLFKEITSNQQPTTSKPIFGIMPHLRQLLLDPELLAEAVSWSWQNNPEIWNELASLCLGCGICTYVCPLCYCFSVEDKVSLDCVTSSRCRQWDACTLPKFAQISGGFNFHKTIKERYYNWYFHKFVRAYKEYGKSQCVACGRCQKYCPAKIDIEKYLIRIVENYQKVDQK